MSLADARNAPPAAEVFGPAPRPRREQKRYRMCRIVEVREGGVLVLHCGHMATTKRATAPRLYARCKTCPEPPVVTPEERARARGLARWEGHERRGVDIEKQRATNRRVQAEIRAERLAAGDCQVCGEEPHEPGRKACAGCLEYERMRVAEWRAGKAAA